MVEVEPKKGAENQVVPQQTQPATGIIKAASPAKLSMVDQTHVLFFQISFLYTNINRERVLRIINHGIKVSGNLSEIYENCDYAVVGNCNVQVMVRSCQEVDSDVLGC